MKIPDKDLDSPDGHELERIRELILGGDRAALQALLAWRDDKSAFSESITSVISEAIALRSVQDNSVAIALGDTIEQSLSESVKNNPEPLADALYPVMGPAIRRSITETMNQTLENFNRVLEQSLSPKSMKWRVEALVSGKSFAEVALIHSLDYQVEQVFLIHRETSLLIQHEVAESAIARDADMVSGMLSAIQDFVSDSFSVESTDTLNTLRLGELTVCIEAGPKALLASVVRGSVPEELRSLMQTTVESIHRTCHRALDEFDGDTDVFADCDLALSSCLITQHSQENKEKKPPVLALAAGLASVFVVGYLLIQNHQHTKLENRTIALLNDTPGILVTGVYRVDDGLRIAGLRDPLAPSVDALIDQETQERLELSTSLRSWHSLDQAMVEQRVADTFAYLPEGVSYSLAGESLVLFGQVEHEWAQYALPAMMLIPGVANLDVSGLEQSAPEPPPLIAAKPDLAELTRGLENQYFYFDSGSSEPDEASMALLNSFVDELQVLDAVAADQGFATSLEVVGFSDRSGSSVANLRVSLRRAETLSRLLDEADQLDINYKVIGRGSVSEELANSMINARHARVQVRLEINKAADL